MILPGQTLGILGGGLLGTSLVHAAQALGYHTRLWLPPLKRAAAGAQAATATSRPDAGGGASQKVAVITNVTKACDDAWLTTVAAEAPLQPSAEVLMACGDRLRIKSWLHRHRFPTVKHAEVFDGDVAAAVARVGRPCVVKDAAFTDGVAAVRIGGDAERARAEAMFRGRRCVVERWVDCGRELAVIVARSAAGEMQAFPVAETIHGRHGLDLGVVPARVSAALAREAEQLALAIAEQIGCVGLLTIELFLADNGALLVHDLTPGPHAAGHWTVDGAETSQFEQQVRAVCGGPLGDVRLRSPIVTARLGGEGAAVDDADPAAAARRWAGLLGASAVKLHLDAAAAAREGYFSVRGESPDTLLERVRELRQRWAESTPA